MTTPTRHTWIGCIERRIDACDSPDGNDRTERVCTTCRAVKVTVHGAQGLPWIEWRSPEGQKLSEAPPCVIADSQRMAA